MYFLRVILIYKVNVLLSVLHLGMGLHFMFMTLHVQVYLLHSTIGQILPRSPCPEIFHYEWMEHSLEPQEIPLKGVITVTSSMPIFLKVKLQIPGALTTEYSGRLKLFQVLPVSASKNLKTAKYNIHYPKNVPLPSIILIQVNNKVVCAANPLRRPVKTTVVWEHALRQNSSDHGGDHEMNGQLGDVDVKNRLDLVKNQFQDMQKTCGKSTKTIPFKVDGTPAKRGDWPWMVPLFKKTELGMQFICSSTLITPEFILTAAHCLRGDENSILDKADLIAYVGKFNIRNWTEDNTQPTEVSDVYVHPDYNPDTLHSDLALLKLKREVRIARFVSPVCIWAEEDDLNFIVHKKGIVSGWGTDNAGHKVTDVPRVAVMPIVSQEECLRSKIEFMFLTSSKTLCAGFRDGTGPCNGDSGGGLFLLRKDKDGDMRWFIRGIVSLSLVQEGTHAMKCNLNEYTVFTDIAKFRAWLLPFLTT